MNKAFIIGLDAATFDLIIPWIKEGALPNLARLMEEGSYGKLKSTPNKVSPAAWTSFSTGKNPGKHGIYHFHAMDPSTLKLRLANATHRDAEPIWSYLSRVGKKVGIFNVPLTFPVDKVNGFMLAGWDAPSIKSEEFSYPSDLSREMLQQFSYIPTTPAIEVYKTNARPELTLRKIHRDLDIRAEMVEYLMKRKEWDFFTAVFVAIDQVQHYFWHEMDGQPSIPGLTKAKIHGGAIRTVYEKCDRIVGRLVNNLDEDTLIVVMSDHGGTINSLGSHYLPRWLEELGLAKTKCAADLKCSSTRYATHQALSTLKKFTYNQLSSRLNYKLKNYLKSIVGTNMGLAKASKLKLAGYDWSQTKVYVAGSNLRVNLKGREIHGIVSPGKEYEDLRDFVIEKLYETRDTETGRKVVKAAFRREEVYHGKHVEEAPDLITAWTEGIVISGMSCTDKNGREIRITERIPSPNKWSGQHSDYGILIAKGPHIIRGKEINNAEILDIAPSIIHLMGLAVPDDIDGRVLTNMLSESFLCRHPIKSTKSRDSSRGRDSNDYSEEDAERVKEQLKNLGYL
ncbi:alkaline phosphatase family protein [Planctomycetota bacterium]